MAMPLSGVVIFAMRVGNTGRNVQYNFECNITGVRVSQLACEQAHSDLDRCCDSQHKEICWRLQRVTPWFA